LSILWLDPDPDIVNAELELVGYEKVVPSKVACIICTGADEADPSCITTIYTPR
tara:strand:+ start:287 stop:448 length:162 start_codon:yes stop_codon:yes gene_type:complete